MAIYPRMVSLIALGLGTIIGCAPQLDKAEPMAANAEEKEKKAADPGDAGARDSEADPPVRLGKIPGLRLLPRDPISAEQAKRIRDLINGLAALDSPDVGLSSTLSGGGFSPVPGQSRADVFLITDHRLQPSEQLQALVTLGPDALPFLLEALDDNTPTKIVVKHDGLKGVMWHAAELDLNPASPAEFAVWKARAGKDREEKGYVNSYTLKVGDVCFVAIGQIVGRRYQAVRYQPTACIVLNCPTHDPNLCAEVRGLWKSADPRKMLFESLCTDYATEGKFNGKSLDGWDFGNQRQCQAALRLLYFFAKESAPLIAGRLDKLDVGKDKELNDHMRRCVANGVRAHEFVKAVAWSKEPDVQKALSRLFQRSDDVEALLAALPAVDNKELIRGRLEPLVAALPAEDGGYGHGYYLLVALGQRTPETARPVFERYLKDGSLHRCRSVCLALRQVRLSWDRELLGPMLKDRRTWGWTYGVEPDRNEPRLEIRVCDEAAITLNANHPEMKFVQTGQHADLDRQIAVILEQLSQKK